MRVFVLHTALQRDPRSAVARPADVVSVHRSYDEAVAAAPRRLLSEMPDGRLPDVTEDRWNYWESMLRDGWAENTVNGWSRVWTWWWGGDHIAEHKVPMSSNSQGEG